MPRRCAIGLEYLLCALTLAWAAHRTLFPLAETDLFFHLKLGDLIVASHHIPFRNLFSFTYPDQPDPDLAWAFQVGCSLLYRAGGFAAIVIAKTLLVVAAVALVWRACRRRGIALLPTALALVAAVETMRPRLVERPHLVTFVGLGALALWWSDLEAHPRRWRWLPVIALGWAQFHAGVFLCPLLTGLWLLGARLEGLTLPWRRALASLALAAAATFATPAGTRLPRYLLWHTGLGSTRIIDEFRHADAWNDPWFFLTGALIVAIAAARPRRWRDLVPAAVLMLLAWRSVRFVAEFALVAAPIVAAGLDRLFAAQAPRLTTSARWPALLATALAVTIVVERVADPEPPGLAADVVPFDAIDFVTQTGLRRRMFHDLDVGCYLAWEGWPRWSVFEDARLPAYPDDFHRAMDGTPLDPPTFDALLRRWDIDAALLNEPGINRHAGSFDPDEWALVWRRPSALVFARRTPEHAAIIAAHELPLRLTFRWEEGSRALPLPAPPRRSPVPPCEWDRRLARVLDDDGEPEGALDARKDALERGCLDAAAEADVRFYLGARRQRGGDLRGAAVQYDRVLALRPDDARALVNRGWARLTVDPIAARADFVRARVLAPGRAGEIDRALQRLATAEKSGARP